MRSRRRVVRRSLRKDGPRQAFLQKIEVEERSRMRGRAETIAGSLRHRSDIHRLLLSQRFRAAVSLGCQSRQVRHHLVCEDAMNDAESTVAPSHELYSSSRQRTWRDTRWLGYPAEKCPLDLWVYQ